MKYALIIGNDNYSDPKLAQLKTPAADSHALANMLSDETIGDFDEVIPLVNQTEADIRRAVSSFLANKKPDDLILVYFSGHGVLDSRGRLFLALKDTQTNILTATAIPSSYIADEMDSCRSKRQILILDCCHSGAFARGAKTGGQKVITETTFEGNGYGRAVLTASDSTQFSFEGDQIISQTELSLFTHFLLEGLRTGAADLNGDGFISLDEWYDYTYSQVLTSTPRQVPHKWSYHQQGDLIIAKNPKLKKKLVKLPADLINLLESPYSSARASAVTELGILLKSSNFELAKLARLTLQKLKEDDSISVSGLAAKELSGANAIRDLPHLEPAPSIKPKLKNKTVNTKFPFLPLPLIFSIGLAIMIIGFFITRDGWRGLFPTPTTHPTIVIVRNTSTATRVSPTPSLKNTPSPTLRVLPTATPVLSKFVVYVKYKNTKLRSGPDLRFKTVGETSIGEECQLIARYHLWYQVECENGNSGWLANDWLEIPDNVNVSNLKELTSSEVLKFSPECKKYGC